MLKNSNLTAYNNYELSNSITSIQYVISIDTKQIFQDYMIKSVLSQKQYQNISNKICQEIGVSPKKVIYDGIQPHEIKDGKLKRKTLGNTNNFNLIRLFKFTAIRKKIVSVKTQLDTLLHEIIHNYDIEVIKLSRSIHSKGFYLRINHLKTQLLSND